MLHHDWYCTMAVRIGFCCLYENTMHYSKHFCISYTSLHFIESQIKSVNASNIPSALNLYFWGLAWCSNQWVRKKHTKRKARQMKILPKKKITENCGEVHFLFGFISSTLFMTHRIISGNGTQRKEEENIEVSKSQWPTGAVLAEGSHDRPAVIFSAHKNECVIQKAIWRSLCTEFGSCTNYVHLT